ncbi:MAG: AAA family ATPase [Planctomycetes bacterium]|nr:AAA family ATPase [Planctomycetota bacterium]
MFDKFTDRARKVMGIARQEAQRFNHEYIGTEHILLGLVQEDAGIGAKALKNLDVDLEKVRHEIEKLIPHGPPTVTMRQFPFTPRAKRVMELALEEACHLGHDYVGTEHLLLGLVRENEGVAAQVLLNLGMKLDELREEVLEILNVSPANAESLDPSQRNTHASALSIYGVCLTSLARENKLDPVVGRAGEIERVLRVLSRRAAGIPVLVGSPGAGKTAIVEGLAQAIVARSVPTQYLDYTLVALDLTWFAAVAGYRKSLEQSIEAILTEARRAPKTLLFLDNLEALIRPDLSPALASAAALVRDALARDNLRAIIATTETHYRAFLARFPGYRHRLTTIQVQPLGPQSSLDALRAMSPRYAEHHGVTYSDDALKACLELATRHFPGVVPLERAIDLLDEAGAQVALATPALPAGAPALDAEIDRLDAEKDAQIARQDFEAAARTRDRAGGLRKQRDALHAEAKAKRREAAPVVDPPAVAVALALMLGGSPETVAAPQA